MSVSSQRICDSSNPVREAERESEIGENTEREMCLSSRTLVECVVPYDYKAEKRERKGGVREREEVKERVGGKKSVSSPTMCGS